MNDLWKTGMMGVVIGDALGMPVQFYSRKEIERRGPVKGMEGHGTYNMPVGTWSDDSSMAIATLDSIVRLKKIDAADIMSGFVRWLRDNEYTPAGRAFDMGITCTDAISNFEVTGNTKTCGITGEYANGNGALMRIMPVVLYALTKNLSEKEATDYIHEIASLTHNHMRSNMACGMYYFIAKEILSDREAELFDVIERGIKKAFDFYSTHPESRELKHYERFSDLKKFRSLDSKKIMSSGYVVHTIEAVIWSLLNTSDFESCLLLAVNLGDDTDTVGAIAGGLAALYYGFESIPQNWLEVVVKYNELSACFEAADATAF